MSIRTANNRVRFSEAQAISVMIIEVYLQFAKQGFDCWITSATDGVHKRDSLHKRGLAIDFRTKHVPRNKMQKIHGAIKQHLSPQYDVLWEDVNGVNEHLHVEYDPD